MAEGMREVGGYVFGFGDIDDYLTNTSVGTPRKARRKKTVRRAKKSYTRKLKKIGRPKRKYRRSTTKKRPGKIYYTKRGQPYKILRSGKARFIKGRRKR